LFEVQLFKDKILTNQVIKANISKLTLILQISLV